MESAIAPLAFGCVFMLVLGVGMLLRARPAEKRLARLSGKPSPAASQRVSMIRDDETGLLRVFRKPASEEDSATPSARRLVHAGFKRPAHRRSPPASISLALGLPSCVSCRSSGACGRSPSCFSSSD